MDISIAIIGAGAIGDYHLSAIKTMNGFKAVAVADINIIKSEQCAEHFQLKSYTDYKQMITEIQPQIVIIALPHFLHKEAAIYCASQGCHVLLEKPMAISTEECSEIMQAAEDYKVIVLIGQTQQYIAQNLQAKSLILQSNLGKLIMINDVRHGPYFTKDRPAWFLDRKLSGGGIMFNIGVHSIDKIQWLTDSRIVKVKANLSYHAAGYPDIEGSAVIVMETSEGAICTVNISGYNGAHREETELVFTHGMIKIINHQSVWISENGEYKEVPPDENSVNPFELQLLDIQQCILEGKQPYASGEYGRSIVRVIEAVYRSAELQAEVPVIID